MVGRGLKYEFVKSAVKPQEYPVDERFEIACLGRSNSGKSSFINALCGGQIAKTSSTPGKTALLNFFNIGSYYRLVDMPGYGFAQRSKADQKQWQEMIENYLALRAQLVGLLLVMDIRRGWSQDEKNLLAWLRPRRLPVALILNKSDKMRRGEALAQREVLRKESGIDSLFIVSTLTNEGIQGVEKFFFDHWIKPRVELLRTNEVTY